VTRVLVIEDEPDIADFLRRGLALKGYDVAVAPDGEQGLSAAHRLPPDIVILDLMLPGLDGIEVCRRLRATGDVPIVVLTARDSVADKVRGLDVGADDYLTKPFSFDELLARMRAALRRVAPGDEILTVGDLTIRPGSREVQRGGRSIELTAREYEVLDVLARNARNIVSKQRLYERVWGYEFDLASDPVKVYVSYLRKKLNAPGEPDLIHAVRGVGYMLKP
jgi:two-component system, OmpR family, response regulator MprA